MFNNLKTFSLVLGVLACGSATAQGNNRGPIGLTMEGDGTFYRPNGNLGACGNRLQNNDAICAVSLDQANEIPCGSCLMVSGPRGQTMVRVQDKCVGCKRGDVDLSEGAFRQVADPVQGRVRVRSQVVDCNTGVAQPSSSRSRVQSARVASPNFGSAGSQDGTCSRDRPCAPGFCCSQFGFCGQGEAFCGAGCQGGDCLGGNQGGSSVQSNCNSANDPFNASGSQDGTCSRDRPCSPGFCCSQFGFCGQGEAFCGTGCQGGDCFRRQQQRCRRRPSGNRRCKRRKRCSRCNRRSNCNNFGGLQSNATSTGFEEGSCSRDRPCEPGFCCSQFGFCGQGEAFCGIGCQGGDCLGGSQDINSQGSF